MSPAFLGRKRKRSVVVAVYPNGRTFVIRRIRDENLRAVWEWETGKSCQLLSDAIACAERAGAVVKRETR